MALGWFKKEPKHVRSEGVFQKCEGCGVMLVIKELEENQRVCKECGYHFKVAACARLLHLIDEDTFEELFGGILSGDPLKFTAKRSYSERYEEARRTTGLDEAVVCCRAAINGKKVMMAVMDPFFMMASMGSAVGEKITRLFEAATAERLPVIVVCASGGARMDEGALSLMQMAKTSAAAARHCQAGLLYISVLTNPTTGGVSASFAFLGDVILAEPKALVGFAGPRVIQQTMNVDLPERFQESEFLLEHGQIDMVIERPRLRSMLTELLTYCEGNRKPAASENTGVGG
jgi:acetyl-CoA carboxylase carboxyl transferase beta subunit